MQTGCPQPCTAHTCLAQKLKLARLMRLGKKCRMAAVMAVSIVDDHHHGGRKVRALRNEHADAHCMSAAVYHTHMPCSRAETSAA